MPNVEESALAVEEKEGKVSVWLVSAVTNQVRLLDTDITKNAKF
jgi:hypothetical protein